MSDQTLSDKPLYSPGDTVLTKYGVAVITDIILQKNDLGDDVDNEPGQFKGRIWRVPEMSIASSANCFLQFDTILKSLPAAPGMISNAMLLDDEKNERISTKILVRCYSSVLDTYLVSKSRTESTSTSTTENVSNESFVKEIIEVKPDQMETAKCAKFYPLMESLMMRGDDAASDHGSFFSKSNIDFVASKTTEVLSMASKSGQDVVTKENVDNITDTIKTYIPDKDNIQQVYSMMKDEELTDLLKKGQDRLRQLIDVDIPQTTEATLSQSGITINLSSNDNASSESQSAIDLSREKALSSLDELLTEHADTNIEDLKLAMTSQFGTVFDSLSTAATSDRYLNSIFDTINEKTSEWQEANGRLFSTKSACLFMEGTQRLQARAGAIFSPEQVFRAKEAGFQLTKAFTEGDAAVARLKSIELGDVVRTRLIDAIEVRSGSKGGLDGIIAEALNSMGGEAATDDAQKQIQMMLANMHDTATSATQNAHECLIEVLSHKSKFRHLAVLRVEQVFVNLDSYLDLTAEEIANIAKGEEGTSALFEPIARRAAKEIEKQLDYADSYVTDPMARSVLSRVRKLISGDLSITGLLTEVEAVLNDDNVVAYGQNLVQQGERVLDYLEDASEYPMMGDVLGIVEKAGLTKEMVIGTVENLDINKVMDAAEAAVTNEEVRREMLSTAADSALDFLLKVLPSLPVPPLDSVKDGMIYHLSNLSLEGFKVRKEDIIVEIAGIRAATSTQESENVLDEISPNALKLGPQGEVIIEKRSSIDAMSSKASSQESLAESSVEEAHVSEDENSVKTTELLIIDVKNISAMMEQVNWSFEQTYFPYLKGSGKAFAELFDGSIRLKFELRRRRLNIANPSSDESAEQWEPVLCLHERKVEIGDVTLKLEGGGKLTWVVNKLVSYFKGALRTYVVRTISNLINSKSGVLLQMLNESLKDYWDIILRMASLSIYDLAEMSSEDLSDSIDLYSNEFELVWREHLPLGMNLLMNDDSRLLKVVDFPRGSQARKVADLRGLDPVVFNGSTITAVNGTRYNDDSQEELVDALRDPARPKTVTFELANPEDAERIRKFVSGFEGFINGNESEDIVSRDNSKKSLVIKKVEIIEEGSIGIQFTNSVDDFALVVKGYSKGKNGETLFAENEKQISKGDILVSVNDESVVGENGSGRSNAVILFEKYALTRPLLLSFTKPYLHLIKLDKKVLGDANVADELELEEIKLSSGACRVLLKHLKGIPGKVEKSGVFIGDHIIYINNTRVGAGCRLSKNPGPRHRLEETLALIEQLGCYPNPFTVTFARPSQTEYRRRRNTFSLETASTVSVIIEDIEQLGCEFTCGSNVDDVVVSNFKSVRGPIMRTIGDEGSWIGMAFESVDGQLVPSFANGKMVLNAINKSMNDKERAEILLCEDELRTQLKSNSAK